MEPFQNCTDTSDISELSLPQQLFLKPEAKLSVTVALPQVRLPGKTISNWEVMERLKQMVRPEEFVVIRVSKSTLEFIRFDAEIENRSRLHHATARLDGKSIKLSGFPEPLKIKAAESKPDFPTRHDWDKYFRDAKNMNEMKPGERPDTVHIQNLPSKWFVSKKDRRNGIETPNEFTLQKVFEIFGEIRCVDIPMLDPYRNQMKASISGIKKFSHSTDATFEAYVQYKEYICFVKAMDALRGMKLVHRDGSKAYSASIKVDFDKTKHLSDMSIRRRKMEREKLMAKEREKEELKRREEEALKQAVEEEKRRRLEEKKLKGERRKEREEKRKQRILKKLKKKEAEQMNIKIAIEERKLLMAQRKLESIRLLDELFERVKQEKQKQETRQKEEEQEEENKSKKKKETKSKKKQDKEKEKKKKENLIDKERELRKKLVKKIKTAQEQQMEERREKLLKTIEGKNKLKSVLRAKQGTEGSNDEFDPHKSRDYPDYDAYPEFGPYDSYRGGYNNYHEWGARGYRGGSYVPRRFRGYRGGGGGGGYNHYYNEWIPHQQSLDGRARTLETEKKKSQEISGTDADGMEDISSDSSSATSKYSHLNSSSEEEDERSGKEGETEPNELKPGAFEDEEKGEGDGNASHPWVGYSDYYNPRFARIRGGRRPRGVYVPRRGWGRGFPPQPNPNVPMNSFYMQSINSQYYKYFNKLAKGDYGDENYRDSRSRSGSGSRLSERVVCRKVLSRSRSRSRRRSYSRSRSRSSSRTGRRSRSRSPTRRSRSKSRSRSRSRRRSRRRSGTRSRSRSRSRKSGSGRRRSKSADRSESEANTRSRRSKSKSPAVGEGTANEVPAPDPKSDRNLDVESSKEASAGKSVKSKSDTVAKQEKKKKSDDKDEDKERTEEKKARSPSKAKSEPGSDWSLSLSGSDGWSGGSPARKARPLGDPAWEPEDPDVRRRRRDRENDRGYRTIMSKVTGTFRSDGFSSYDRNRDRYRRPGYRFEDRPPNLRSHVARPAADNPETYHSDASTKDSKKSRHKKDKKRKRKHAPKDSDSKKRKRTDS